MDFFEHQEQARKRSKLLVVHFILAIIGIITTIYLVAIIATGFKGSGGLEAGSSPVDLLWNPELLSWTSIITTAVILLGSGYKTLQLASGGGAIARDLGGRQLDPNTTDTDERRLLNIVEEMSIASGIPAPDVFLMDHEESINAFAAGNTISDAVIGVTRGCATRLSRDELQGVIAHEFSHILNGDMRLNLRLVGLLFGILSLAIIGQFMMRAGGRSARYSRRDNQGAAAGFFMAGIALYIIGYVGVFFGHLIKAAVSRQREFLADASAVQFTRNPDGLANALKKVGGLSQGSQLTTPKAEEASHMFFANGLTSGFLGLSGLFASHPPLPERIRAIEQSWDGEFVTPAEPEISRGWRKRKGRGGKGRRNKERERDNDEDFLGQGGILGEILTSGFNGPNHQQVAAAQEIRSNFPQDWIRHLHHPAGAQAIVFALLLSSDELLRGAEERRLEATVDPTTFEETIRLQQELRDIGSAEKLALIDLAIPALRKLSPREYDRFLNVVQELIGSDGEVDLFEFTLQKILKRHLDLAFHRTKKSKILHDTIAPLANQASVLLTTLAALGSRDATTIDEAFRLGAHELQKSGEEISVLFLQPEDCGLSHVDSALNDFDHASPIIKRTLLSACARTAMADGILTNDEAELLRAIADTIGCPIPPLVRSER